MTKQTVIIDGVKVTPRNSGNNTIVQVDNTASEEVKTPPTQEVTETAPPADNGGGVTQIANVIGDGVISTQISGTGTVNIKRR